jgi:hypothetical protein
MSPATLAPKDHERAASELKNGSAHFASSSHSNVGEHRKARHEKDEWDKQIEEDAKAGKLDDLMQEARRDHKQGNTKPLP